jgi:WD40 repeat protein
MAPASDTTKAKQVTRNDHAVGRFSWTSDGRIIFASGDGNLSILNSDGSVRTLLTPNDHAIWDPSICGDGRYIVYSAYREQKVGVWRMDADGSNPIRIADEMVAVSPQCSPDGKWVIYLQGASLTPMRVTITGERPPEPIAQSPAVWIGDVLAFSPDGKLVYRVLTKGHVTDWAPVDGTTYAGGPVTLEFQVDTKEGVISVFVNRDLVLKQTLADLKRFKRTVELQIFCQAQIDRKVHFSADNVVIVTLKDPK